MRKVEVFSSSVEENNIKCLGLKFARTRLEDRIFFNPSTEDSDYLSHYKYSRKNMVGYIEPTRVIIPILEPEKWEGLYSRL